MTPTLLELLRCPVCRGSLDDEGKTALPRLHAVFPVEDDMPRMLDDRLPGIDAKRREIEGWPAMAKAHGWYERDDEVDAHLPYSTDLGWDDKNWRATEHRSRSCSIAMCVPACACWRSARRRRGRRSTSCRSAASTWRPTSSPTP